MIYELMKGQVREHRKWREIDGGALAQVIELYGIEDKTGCFEKVLAASRELMNE